MIVFGVVLFCTVNLLSFSVPGRHYRDRNRLGVRRPVNWQQRTSHPPNDWIQTVHLVFFCLTWEPSNDASNQIAFAPIATCFQFAPSLMAMHGTEPVPPALK